MLVRRAEMVLTGWWCMQYEEWTAAQTADTQEMRDAAAASYMDSHHRATHRATQSGNTLSNRSHNTAHNCVVQPNTETGMQQTDGSEADDW